MEAVAFTDSGHHDFAMVDFYAADCGHCHQFAPVWAKASQGSSLPLNWETKECYGPGWSHGKAFDLCKDLNVTRFPTVKLVQFDHAGHPVNSWDFNGSRTAQSLEDFANERLHAVGNIMQQSMDPLLSLLSFIKPRYCHRQSLAAFL